MHVSISGSLSPSPVSPVRPVSVRRIIRNCPNQVRPCIATRNNDACSRIGPERRLAMYPLDLDKLTPEQRAMVALWEAHQKAEFQDKDARASCDTMVANPYVNHVPVLTGGVGRR